jgi:hypothetical protein
MPVGKSVTRRIRIWLGLAVTLACLAAAPPAFADNVRGQLVRGNNPVAGVSVNLVGPSGQSGTAYSGRDGMYYFFNIAPGNYRLQVWDLPKGPALEFEITVYRQQWTDIRPIQLRSR